MDTLIALYADFQAMMKANPVVAGAFSLWGLACVTYIVKVIPGRIASFFRRQFTTSLTVNNAGWRGNEEQFNGFIDWYSKTGWLRWSRNLSLDSKNWNAEQIIVSAGVGLHIFFWKGRLFWFERVKLESSGTDKEKHEITIMTLGRNQRPILDLVESFRYRPDESQLKIFSFKDDWNMVATIPRRSIDTVIINRNLKRRLIRDIEYFTNNREWYQRRGMPHKLTFVLHGVPGTGKTSLVSALAAHFNRNICVLSLASMSDTTFANAMATIPKNSVVLIEDFDSAGAVKSRGLSGFVNTLRAAPADAPSDGDVIANSVATLEPAKPRELDLDSYSFLTLSSVLNTLDGVVRLDDTILFMTTNCLDKIDPAVLRKGRVDHIYEIEIMKHDEVVDYIKLMYPEVEVPSDLYYHPIAGCDIQALFMEHKEDFNGFHDALSKQPYDGRVMGLHLVDKLKALP